jgi:hypothetical protein
LRPISITCLFAAVALASAACDPSTDADDAQTDPLDECQLKCEETYAEELLPENCHDWCAVSASLASDGTCTCTFNSCVVSLCTQWCVDNEDLPVGVCYFDDCNCTN